MHMGYREGGTGSTRLVSMEKVTCGGLAGHEEVADRSGLSRLKGQEGQMAVDKVEVVQGSLRNHLQQEYEQSTGMPEEGCWGL